MRHWVMAWLDYLKERGAENRWGMRVVTAETGSSIQWHLSNVARSRKVDMSR